MLTFFQNLPSFKIGAYRLVLIKDNVCIQINILVVMIDFPYTKSDSSQIRNFISHYQGPGNRGGPGPPLELRFYRVKIFKIGKISFFVLLGPPLGKNRSQAPVYIRHIQVNTCIPGLGFLLQS